MTDAKMTEAPQPVRNDSLVESIAAAKKDGSRENTVHMLNEVVRAKLLAPITLDQEPIVEGEDGQVVLEKDTTISFELIKANNGDLYYPVFTHGEELRKCSTEKNQHSMIVNFEDLANMILNQGKVVRGFVINPMGDNICFTQEMIQGMIDDMKKQTDEKNAQA